MSDKPKIIAGLVIFLALATFPFWYAQLAPALGAVPFLHSQAAPEPVLTPPTDGSHCIEEAAWMKAHHMELLNDWRDRVVRDGERYVEIDGVQWEMSLTNTCMKCHDNKPGFCEQCHDYLGVAPYCWDCHLTPEVLDQ